MGFRVWGVLFGGPIRTMVFWGRYWDPPVLGKSPHDYLLTSIEASFRGFRVSEQNFLHILKALLCRDHFLRVRADSTLPSEIAIDDIAVLSTNNVLDSR